MMSARRWMQSLPGRVVLMLSLALLPLGLISLFQTITVLGEVRSVTRAALIERTMAAASDARESIQEAFGAAQALEAAIMTVRPDLCSAIMTEFVIQHPQFIFAAFTPRDGHQTCRSAGPALDLTGTQDHQRVLRDETPYVAVSPSGMVGGLPLAVVTQPVAHQQAMVGYISISIPHRIADRLDLGAQGFDDLRLVALEPGGALLSASGPLDSAMHSLPSDVSTAELMDRVGSTFVARAHGGARRLYTVSAMVPDSVVLLGSLPITSPWGAGLSPNALMPLVFPVLMWVVSVLVAYLGLQKLVIRHMIRLRDAMGQFAQGHLGEERLQLDNPPAELRETEHAFNHMVARLAKAETQRDQDLIDKEVLLKEVHHRVKNNLQLVASIMNMQSRLADTSEAKSMLSNLQRRVRGLATLHRLLYADAKTASVDVAEMIDAMIEDVLNLSGFADLEICSDLYPVPLFPDQAVPLSMLVSEAITNAVKNLGRPSDGPPRIAITLRKGAGRQVVLSIENTMGADLLPDGAGQQEGDGLAAQLMRAFVRQLEGQANVSESKTAYRLEIRFDAKEFVPIST